MIRQQINLTWKEVTTSNPSWALFTIHSKFRAERGPDRGRRRICATCSDLCLYDLSPLYCCCFHHLVWFHRKSLRFPILKTRRNHSDHWSRWLGPINVLLANQIIIISVSRDGFLLASQGCSSVFRTNLRRVCSVMQAWEHPDSLRETSLLLALEGIIRWAKDSIVFCSCGV